MIRNHGLVIVQCDLFLAGKAYPVSVFPMIKVMVTVTKFLTTEFTVICVDVEVQRNVVSKGAISCKGFSTQRTNCLFIKEMLILNVSNQACDFISTFLRLVRTTEFAP